MFMFLASKAPSCDSCLSSPYFTRISFPALISCLVFGSSISMFFFFFFCRSLIFKLQGETSLSAKIMAKKLKHKKLIYYTHLLIRMNIKIPIIWNWNSHIVSNSTNCHWNGNWNWKMNYENFVYWALKYNEIMFCVKEQHHLDQHCLHLKNEISKT